MNPMDDELAAVIRDDWIGHGLSTSPADRDRAVLASWEAIELAGGRRLSQVAIWVQSPLAGVLAAASVGFAFGDALAQRAIAPVLAAARSNNPAVQQIRREVDKSVAPVRAAVHQQIEREVQERGPAFEQRRREIGNYAWNQVWEEIGDPIYSHGWEQQARRSEGLFDENVAVWEDALLEGQFGAGLMAALEARSILGELDTEPFTGIRRGTVSCNWWWLWTSCAVFCERPSVVEVRGKKVYVEFRDGWTVRT